MHRRRRGRRGRMPVQPRLGARFKATRMNPEPESDERPIYIDPAEAEVLRLVDLEGMYQEDAGDAMGVSRGTIWRLLETARRKVVSSLFEGRPLIIGHGPDED